MTEEDYLKLFKISEGKYIIGIFQDTITVYKQQMRALNIFDALVKKEVIKFGSDFSIAIIGGGIAGLTFAAAALKSNISVIIFEKEAEYLHMQQGCDTRKIHPNIYDWPDPGSTFPNARLPVLSWTHDTASNVVKQIVNGLSEISEQIKTSDHDQAPALFVEHKNSKIHSIDDPTAKTKDKFAITHGPHKVKAFADLVIYAVGYGVERNLKESNTASYWRNDSLSQSVLNDKRNFFISGRGDGALIDLCRIKLRHYNYDHILELLKSDQRKYDLLVSALRKIKDKGRGRTDLDNDFLDTEFEMLQPTYYNYFYDQLSKEIVAENTVILHSRQKHEYIFDFTKVSMLNAFIVFLLKRDKQFEFTNGELKLESGKYYLNGNLIEYIDQFVIRHGTDTETVIDNMYLNGAESTNLKTLSELQKATMDIENCWTFKSISTCFVKGSQVPEFAVLPYLKRSEYVTPDTKMVCLPFVVTLAKTLGRLMGNNKHFRIALLRVVQFDGQNYFQQITPYQGSKRANGDGCFGNVHSIDLGIVGQSIQSGKALYISNVEQEAFQDLLSALNLCKERKTEATAKSYLAIPVLSQLKSNEMATNLVLYLDSEDETFLQKPGIADVIVGSLSGFVDSIERMIELNMIIMNEQEFDPCKTTGLKLNNLESSSCYIDLEASYSREFGSKAAIRFKNFYSFDIIYNK